MKPTKAQLKRYLVAGGTSCLLCGGDQVEGGFVEVTATGAQQRIHCLDCGRSWIDIHRRVDVVLEDGDPT